MGGSVLESRVGEHISYLQGLAASGNMEGIKDYLQNAWSDIDYITPMRFCENERRKICLKIYHKNRKLCIDIRNTCQKEPIFKNEIPVSKQLGHGYGTKSMVHIIEKHEGICRFSYEDGWFIFQAII